MKLHAIIIGKEAKAPLGYVDEAEVVADKGIVGDRYYYRCGTFNKPQLSQSVRQISLIDFETLAICNERIEGNLDFLDLRRNLVVKGGDIAALEKRTFAIGDAQFRILRSCPPCRYLSRLLDADMMQGLKYIGGYRAQILQSGTIRVGDQIVLL